MTPLQRSRIRSARAYIAGLILLHRAKAAGKLADPRAIEAELQRALDTLDEVLAPPGPPPKDAA